MNLTDEELAIAIPVMQKLLWADKEQRKEVQAHGLNVIPSNIYSNTPSISETLASYEYSEAAPYLNTAIFDEHKMRAELSSLIPFSADFSAPPHGEEETCDYFFWNNPMFSFSDAMSYWAYIRRLKPRRIVEVGSGFSSLIALEALNRNGKGQLTCIEPFPRPFVSQLGTKKAIDLHVIRAQEVSPELLNALLSDGDILFIDSTHTVKTGSDCLHIYLRLLPCIRKRIYLHVHDIFLPFGMPQSWMFDHHFYWTEQYLLMAWMIDNPRASLLYGSAYHNHFNPDLLDSFMHGQFPRGGGSVWLEYDGRR
jgi:hypothetical protein